MWILSGLLATFLIVFYYCRKALARFKIKTWHKALSLDKHLASYQSLFTKVDGFRLSRQARIENDALEYTYGEIEFIPFIALLSLASPNSNTLFYDLGSGIGKAVFACALVYNVQKSCGIELLRSLHTTAQSLHQQLEQKPDYHTTVPSLHFINADFLTIDFSDATLVFINATAYFGETWQKINLCLKQLKPGAIVITTSKQLMSDDFLMFRVTSVQMSWGVVKAYLHERTI